MGGQRGTRLLSALHAAGAAPGLQAASSFASELPGGKVGWVGGGDEKEKAVRRVADSGSANVELVALLGRVRLADPCENRTPGPRKWAQMGGCCELVIGLLCQTSGV